MSTLDLIRAKRRLCLENKDPDGRFVLRYWSAPRAEAHELIEDDLPKLLAVVEAARLYVEPLPYGDEIKTSKIRGDNLRAALAALEAE